MLSIAILDDNIKVLEEYENKIPVWLKKNNIKGQIVVATTNYNEFLKEVRSQVANVCIMDINLNGEVNGHYIASRIRKENIQTEIIFCSGMLEYLPKSFEVNAYYFIPKPLNNALEKALVKLNDEIESRSVSKRTIEVKYGSQIYYVPLESIIYFKTEGDKTTITTTGRSLEITSSLGAFYKKLNDDRFIQCHKSTVINREYIDFIDIKDKTVHLNNNHICEIGSKYYSNFACRREEQYAV